MLAYQGVGDATAAARERVLYERFKADEASQAITGPYRQLHPDDNNERQQIHEHITAGARHSGLGTAPAARASGGGAPRALIEDVRGPGLGAAGAQR
jgi:hypothetical protein